MSSGGGEALAQEPLIRNISDTARWVAMHRAIETERPDALFRDRFARRLAGERGQEIVRQFPRTGEWSWALRTHLFDQAILAAVGSGCDTVVNLAAGFDARPYRLRLPETLRWVEVDLRELLREKEEMLRGEKPVCQLERVAVDLADEGARRALFARVGSTTQKALVVSEGLLIYLEREEVVALGRDLTAVPALPALGAGHRFAGPAEDGAEKLGSAARGRRVSAEVRPAGRPGIF